MSKSFLLIFFVLLSVSFVSADLTTNNLLYYSLDNTNLSGSNPLDLSVNGFDGTNFGASTGVSGIINEGFDFVSSDPDYVTFSSLGLSTTDDFSINLWIDFDDLTNFNFIVDLSAELDIVIGSNHPTSFGGVGYFFGKIYNSTTNVAVWDAIPDTTQYHMITFTKSSVNGLRLYLDNSLVDSDATLTNPRIQANNNVLGSNGDSLGAGQNFDGKLDEVSIFDKELSVIEIDDLYNSGVGLNFYAIPQVTSDPLFVSPSPVNDSHNNTQVLFNVSCVDGFVYSWFDGILVIDNVSFVASYLTDVNDSGTYSMVAGCFNSSISGWSNNVSRVWNYDATYPAIVINPNNAYSLLNLSLINQYNNSMLLNFTFTDDIDLFAYSVNITQNNVNVFFNDTSESLSGLSYDYFRSLNTSSWLSGWYDVEVLVSDSHTKNEIKPYVVKKENKKLVFDTEEGNSVIVESDDDSLVDAVKFKDRYEFSFDFGDVVSKKRLFHVKSDNVIVYRENSVYPAHFVIFNDFGGNWVDFGGVGLNPVVTKVSDYHYIVEFPKVSGKLSFKSIGGLNVYSSYNKWFLGDYSLVAEPTGTNESTELSISLSRDAVSMDVFSAVLWYNGSVYSSPIMSDSGSSVTFSQSLMTPDGEGDVPFYWNISYNQSDGSSFSFNVSSFQSVFDWSLFNCSLGSPNVSFYLNVYDENFPSKSLLSTIDLSIDSWISDDDNVHSFYHKFSGASSYAVCIYPNDVSLRMNLYAQYNVSNGFTHRYYLSNYSVSNITQNISMFNANSTSGFSDLRITLNNNLDNSFYSDITVKLLRNYLSENVWRTVQMDRSGDFGTIIFHIKEQNTDYKLLYFDSDNHLLKETKTLKFSCSSGLCELTQLLSAWSGVSYVDNISVSYSLDNITGLLSIDWFDSQANNNKVEVRVSKETLTGSFNICDVFQTGASGHVVCDVSAYNGNVLLTVLTSHSPYTPISSVWLSLGKVTLSNFIDDTESSLWTFGLALTLLGFGLWSPIVAIVMMIASLIFMFFLGIFSPLSITFIIVASALGIAIGVKIKR